MPATLTLTLADGQSLAVTIPTSMAEVTLAQWITFATPDGPEADSVMTGLSPEVLGTLSDDNRAAILEQLMFLTDGYILDELLPTPNLYEVGNCAYGLAQQAMKYFLAHPDLTRLAQGAYLCALFRAPVAATMPDDELAAAHAAVLTCPVTDVIADCNYFLASWERSENQTTLPGPRQPGLMSITWEKMPSQGKAPATAGATGWMARLGLANLWNPTPRVVA